MIGLLIIFLAAALPLGIVVFAVVATKYSARSGVDSTPVCPAVGRGVAALVFGAAAVFSLFAIHLASGTQLSADYFGFALIWIAIPAIAIASVLAAVLHRPLVHSRKLGAVFYGGAVALLTVLAVSALTAMIAVSGPSDMMGIFMFGTVIVLLQFGVLIFSVGAVAGLFLNLISKRRCTDVLRTVDTSVS